MTSGLVGSNFLFGRKQLPSGHEVGMFWGQYRPNEYGKTNVTPLCSNCEKSKTDLTPLCSNCEKSKTDLTPLPNTV